MQTAEKNPIKASPRLGLNQSMECFKLLAAIFVVFAHAPFPGDLGKCASCVARCAVPGFFAISGFFSYQTESKKLRKRALHIFRLMLAGCAVKLFWDCLVIEQNGGSTIGYLRAMIPNVQELASWIVLNINPVSDHLWYLAAALECYLVLWAYARFFGEEPIRYEPLYLVGLGLFGVNLAAGVFAGAAGGSATLLLYRNALFFGIPMFAMGLFLRQHWQRILENFHLTAGRLVLLAAAGIGLSLVEWYGIGLNDTNIGSVLAVIALMLLMIRHPRITDFRAGQKLASKFGFLSTAVYIVHPVVIEAYTAWLQPAVFARLGAKEPWVNPLIIAGLSLLISALWERLLHLTGLLFQKFRKEAAK